MRWFISLNFFKVNQIDFSCEELLSESVHRFAFLHYHLVPLSRWKMCIREQILTTFFIFTAAHRVWVWVDLNNAAIISRIFVHFSVLFFFSVHVQQWKKLEIFICDNSWGSSVFFMNEHVSAWRLWRKKFSSLEQSNIKATRFHVINES